MDYDKILTWLKASREIKLKQGRFVNDIDKEIKRIERGNDV